MVDLTLFFLTLLITMPRTKTDTLDYDPNIQKQFAAAQEIPWPEGVVKNTALINREELEESAGANREWYWNAMMPPAAYFSNFMQVQVHPGWIGKVSRFGAPAPAS